MGYAIQIRSPGRFGSDGLFGSRAKYEFQELEKFADLRARDQERRQQAQRKIVCAIDQQASLHGFADERRASDGKFDANHQALRADFADEVEFRGKFHKAIAQLRPARPNIFEKFFVLDDFEEFKSRGARQRAAAKRSAMHPGRNTRSHFCGGENGAQRKTGSQRLGDQNNVRLGREFLISETAAGAAKSALNFIGDQQSAVLRCKGASAVPEFFADGIDAAFALNRFEKYGANGVVKFRFEIREIVEAHELDAGNDRRERQPVFFRGGDADGAKGAPMKGIFQSQEAVLLRRRPRGFVWLAPVQPREFHGSVNGFRAAV